MTQTKTVVQKVEYNEYISGSNSVWSICTEQVITNKQPTGQTTQFQPVKMEIPAVSARKKDDGCASACCDLATSSLFYLCCCCCFTNCCGE